ncbi:TPA: NADH-quinone oxidoreductase subunit F, partial [Candidatus Poribacteria bacterium]|nr:NADH-quinone oxidoreductase subunit F [Candidatus Poribacteria bacterium]HEX28995.1 NADH-quinone oxidoreductase subunit F [Candidatus Poribacteria bacterium]
MKLKTPSDLEELRRSILEERKTDKPCIAVCGGTGCQAYGSQKVVEAFKEELKRRSLEEAISLKVTGCHGFCERGVVVVIHPEEIFYQRVKPEDAPDIISGVMDGTPVERLLYEDPNTGRKILHRDDIPFYKGQQRLIFGNNGLIDPTDIKDYIAIGGYSALAKVLSGMEPEEVIDIIKRSGLRGRGGGGFPTGVKWEACRKAEGEIKHVVCNADEGDPGAYMDRSLLEGNPHSVLEGMIIGAYAIGAHQGYVYVRYEYPLALKHISLAIQQAEEYGLLGTNIMGSGFDFNVKVVRGGGAF